MRIGSGGQHHIERTIDMKCATPFLSCVLFVSVLGCQVQHTDIVRTVKMPDGTETTYTNKSSGYGYNPNYTSDQNINVTAPNAAAVVGVNAGGGGGSWGFGSMNGYNNYSGLYGNIGYNANLGNYGNCSPTYSPFTRTYGPPCYTEQQACTSQQFSVR